MSTRAGSSHASAPLGGVGSSSNRFANRRQERMRGAGKHEIMQRKYNFFSNNKSTQQRRSSSAMSSSSTPATFLPSSPRLQQAATAAVYSTPFHNRSNDKRQREVSLTPAMSVRSGRDFNPSSSPSKYIDPRLLADQSHHQQIVQGSSSINLRLIGKTIDQRRQERMRGAGTHQIEPRSIRFHPGRVSDVAASSDSGRETWKSPGSLDRFMDSLPNFPDHETPPEIEVGNGKYSWIEQRRMERRRGAGTHVIEKRNVVFGSVSARPSDASESIQEEVEEDERSRTLTSTSNLWPRPFESTPKRTKELFRFDDDDDGMREEQGSTVVFENDEYMPQMDYEQQNDSMQISQSPGSIAAQKAMQKRKPKRQSSPLQSVQRKAKIKGKMGAAAVKRGPNVQRVIDLGVLDEADETILGQADITLQEQREAAFTAPEPPIWTFPKKSVTNEELMEMKSQVQEMVTLALGSEAGAVRTVKVNDADVLWSVLKREFQIATNQNNFSSISQDILDQISSSLLSTFTLLSQQSAERSQLIHHLVQARRRNLHIRKQVFRKRSQVLEVARTMQVLEKQEFKRVQREEDEEKSSQFLIKLYQVSHEWC